MRTTQLPMIHSLGLLALALSICSATVVEAQPASCDAAAWTVDQLYERGDFAAHNNTGWKAKRSSEGVEPGTHKPSWQNQGECASEPPPPPPPPPPGSGEMEIFGLWHAGNHYADWALPRDVNGEFDAANRWIIDRGDGHPSVNLVILSFLHPMQVLNMTPGDPTTGVPLGMSMDVVKYFQDADIRVMMSIGGITYTDAWDEALATDPELLAINAAEIAAYFNVGIEIDYERNTGANLEALEVFVQTYRGIHEYDASGVNHAARFTIDLAAGARYLQELNEYATVHWLDNDNPVLDYANAMVHRSSGTPTNWQEHVVGKPQYDPPIPPKAPNRFTGGLFLKGNTANCLNFPSSEQAEHAGYVLTVPPAGAGTTAGMLGYMFWAAEFPSARKNYVGTVPPNTCEDGMGQSMTQFNVPVPMPPLRQE